MFAALIGQLGKKSLGQQLDDQLAEMTHKIRATGKAGKITLTLTLKPKDADGSLVDVSHKIASTMPEIESRPTLFFTTEGGQLTRTDPSQKELEFTAVDGGKTDEPATTQPQISAAQ